MKSRIPDLVLIAVTIIWGATFLGTRTSMRETGPFPFLALRFTVGAVVIGVFARGRPSRKEIIAGLIIGAIILVGYSLQTAGLQYTASSKSAFITALYVPLVPLLQRPFTGTRPTRSAWLGVAVSFSGLILLSFDGHWNFSFGKGELLTLGGAIASSLQIVVISRFANDGNSTRMTAIQLAFVAVASIVLCGFQRPLHMGPHALAIGIAMGVLGTAVALWAMNWAQKSVPPARATLIYALEPVWAGLFGAMAGESIAPMAIAGAALIVGGILAAEFLPPGIVPSRCAEAVA